MPKFFVRKVAADWVVTPEDLEAAVAPAILEKWTPVEAENLEDAVAKAERETYVVIDIQHYTRAGSAMTGFVVYRYGPEEAKYLRMGNYECTGWLNSERLVELAEKLKF